MLTITKSNRMCSAFFVKLAISGCTHCKDFFHHGEAYQKYSNQIVASTNPRWNKSYCIDN